MKSGQPSSSRGSLFRFRLWHIFAIIAVAAWYAPNLTIFGNSLAIVEIEKISVSHDDIWEKHWAILDGRFIAPGFLKRKKLQCFIEVDSDFRFSDEYEVGDCLKFRYQHKEFGSWAKEDPRQIIVREFFGFRVVPMQYDSGLLIRVGQTEKKVD